MDAAKGNRYGHRDATMILVAYRHGLRVASWWTCAGIRSTSRATCMSAGSRMARPARIPSGATSCAPCAGCSASSSPVPFRVHLRAGRAVHHGRLCRMLARAGDRGRLGFKAHPHMLRHACGFALANKGHDTRALQDISAIEHPAHRALHRAVARRFKDFWR